MIIKAKMRTILPLPRRQKGNALLVSLALLGALSILGVSAMRIALTEEKISRNVQELHLTTESAQSGLRFGQQFLENNAHLSAPEGYYKSYGTNATVPNLNATSWINSKSYQLSAIDLARTDSDFSQAYIDQQRPRFMLEEFKVVTDKNIGSSLSAEQQQIKGTTYYRVISRGIGIGARDNPGGSTIMIESTVIENAQ